MKAWIRLALILCVAVAISAGISHGAIHWFKIRAGFAGAQRYGPESQSALTILHGSSLAFDGIDWGRVAPFFGGAIESWATAGSSPSEWEIQHRRSPQAVQAIVVVSPYDLNEYWLSDFRADIVPFADAIRDLRYCAPDSLLCKRIISQYPQMLVRELFPTAGRADGVMVGVRTKLGPLAGGASGGEAQDAPRFGAPGPSSSVEQLSDWSPARLQRRLVLMRRGFQGKHWFDGPKKMALLRLLEQIERQGTAVIVVMPVSPIYRRELMSPQAAQDFERELAQLQQLHPGTPLIRLDRVAALDDDRMFSDLVHLNALGQSIATAALIANLEKGSNRQ